jgi:hypothetical protein
MPIAVPSPDDDFAVFEKRRGLGQRSCSRKEACEILGVSEWQLDKLVAAGDLQPFRIGAKKYQFWVPDLVRFQWERRVSGAAPYAAPKTPPKSNERGRPRKEVHQVGRAP